MAVTDDVTSAIDVIFPLMRPQLSLTELRLVLRGH